MEIGTEISQKIRSAIKSKLIELGTYVDEELPDYIMVMVANRKSEKQMTQDLQLFLGENTAVFTSWLHSLLDRLKSITVESLKKTDSAKDADINIKSNERESNKMSTSDKATAGKDDTSIKHVEPHKIRNENDTKVPTKKHRLPEKTSIQNNQTHEKDRHEKKKEKTFQTTLKDKPLSEKEIAKHEKSEGEKYGNTVHERSKEIEVKNTKSLNIQIRKDEVPLASQVKTSDSKVLSSSLSKGTSKKRKVPLMVPPSVRAKIKKSQASEKSDTIFDGTNAVLDSPTVKVRENLKEQKDYSEFEQGPHKEKTSKCELAVRKSEIERRDSNNEMMKCSTDSTVHNEKAAEVVMQVDSSLKVKHPEKCDDASADESVDLAESRPTVKTKTDRREFKEKKVDRRDKSKYRHAVVTDNVTTAGNTDLEKNFKHRTEKEKIYPKTAQKIHKKDKSEVEIKKVLADSHKSEGKGDYQTNAKVISQESNRDVKNDVEAVPELLEKLEHDEFTEEFKEEERQNKKAEVRDKRPAKRQRRPTPDMSEYKQRRRRPTPDMSEYSSSRISSSAVTTRKGRFTSPLKVADAKSKLPKDNPNVSFVPSPFCEPIPAYMVPVASEDQPEGANAARHSSDDGESPPRSRSSRGPRSTVTSIRKKEVSRDSDNEEDEYDPLKPAVGSVASIIKVTERRKLPKSMQANKTLLLKALSDAAKSSSAASIKYEAATVPAIQRGTDGKLCLLSRSRRQEMMRPLCQVSSRSERVESGHFIFTGMVSDSRQVEVKKDATHKISSLKEAERDERKVYEATISDSDSISDDESLSEDSVSEDSVSDDSPVEWVEKDRVELTYSSDKRTAVMSHSDNIGVSVGKSAKVEEKAAKLLMASDKQPMADRNDVVKSSADYADTQTFRDDDRDNILNSKLDGVTTLDKDKRSAVDDGPVTQPSVGHVDHKDQVTLRASECVETETDQELRKTLLAMSSEKYDPQMEPSLNPKQQSSSSYASVYIPTPTNHNLVKNMDKDANESEADTKFIVTLDGVNSSQTKAALPVAEVRPAAQVAPMRHKRPKVEKVAINLCDSDADGSDANNTPEKSKKLSNFTHERCRYWPDCSSGNSCPYYHPTKPCKSFPDCGFGDKCLYIHPKCRYDRACTKKKCPFTHPKRFIPPTPAFVPQYIPMYPVMSMQSKICRFHPKCSNPLCRFSHPVVCRYGNDCSASSCQYYHPEWSYPWFA